MQLAARRQHILTPGLPHRHRNAGIEKYPLEPRHLRAYRLGAEREADRIGQLVAPLLRQRNPESRRTATSRAEELIALGAQLQRLILEERLAHLLRS